MKSRADQIAAGKVWTVHSHESIKPQVTLFEGTRAACVRWMKEHRFFRDYKRGKMVRLGQTIWENTCN